MLLDIPFDHYYPYDELTSYLRQIAEAHPNLFKLESIGKSYQGRDIWCVTATNTATGPANEKPALWVDGNIHATEVSAASACIYLLKTLAEGHGTDPEITRCLDTRAFYVTPRVNPDGAEAFFAKEPKYVRSSMRPYPYDEEPIEGLKRVDVDGDGRILQMRVVDPNGPWKKSPDEPRLLVRRDPTEEGGTYYRLLPEGLLENWDGVTLTVQANKEGLDLNRNFPSGWRQEGEQFGAGPFPTSEPEVHTIVSFITSHPNITGGITFHTFSGVLLRPFEDKPDDKFPAEDLWTYQAIGKKGTELTGYPNISVHHEFKYHPNEHISGVFDDWIYEHLGLFGWTVEIWSPQKQAGIGEYKYIDWYRDHPLEDDLKMLAWSDEKLDSKGYVDWYSYEHPQLGTVEIGGWDGIHAFRNPPHPFIESEIAKFPKWLLWHLLISPKLELHSLTAEALGGGAHRIEVVVDNTGWLPTYVTKKALERKVSRGVIAEIELPEGATLKTGSKREELGQLEGRAYKTVGAFGWTSDTTDHRTVCRWTVVGKSGDVVKVTVRQERAGTVRGEVVLG